MKLVCDSCGTKYSIGDDRVAGKVFKIRCKKCANVMVVRGAAVEQAPSPAEPVATTSDEWHVVIEGAQSGPFSRVELVRRHAAGELDDDSFVWREGLADWVALGSLEELRAELARVAPPGEATAVTAAPEPTPVADAPRLLAERNESSVLFTLGNLAKLASTPANAAPAPTSTGGTEGSGLIDIRALASSFAPAKSAKPQGAIGSADDLPVFAPATFGEPIVFVPDVRPKGPDRRLLIALVATIAMLAVLAVVLVIVLRRDPEPVAGEATPTRLATAGSPGGELGASNGNAPDGHAPNGDRNAPNGNAPNNAPNANGADGPNGSAPNGKAPNGKAPNNAPNANGADGPNGSVPNGKAPNANGTPTTPTRTTRTTPTRTAPTQSTRTPARTPTLTPDKEPNSCTDVSCMVNNYKDPCCEKFKPRATNTTITTPPTGTLNENLDRAQLAAGIATIRAQACGGRSSAKGDVSVSVKVSPDGAVTGVTIKSSPDPVLSACVTQAAQKGTFAKTKRGGSFAYLWRF